MSYRVLLIPAILLALLLAVESGEAAPSTKSTDKKTTVKKTAAKKPAAKKTTTAKNSIAKTAAAKTKTRPLSAAQRKAALKKKSVVPRPPVVSAKTKAQSIEYVSEAMDEVAAAAVENSAAIVPFFEQLYQLETDKSRSLHILQYGDSHTASDDWANQLRVMFQSRFGNGGAGFSYAGRPFAGYRRFDVKGGQTGRWETEGLLTKGVDGFYGVGGASITSQRPGEMVYLDAEGSKVELSYLKQPGGGAFRVFIEGAEVAKVDTNGEMAPGFWSMELPQDAAGSGPRRFTVETLSSLPVKLFGWVTERVGGLTYETLGINGAQANISMRWDEKQLQSHLEKRNPALIVFAYGTNEAGNKDWTSATYSAMFREVLGRFRKMAPSASFLVVGPPDRAQRSNRKWVGVPKLDLIVEAQREVALEMGCAFWDLRNRMGGEGAIQRWVYAGFAQGDFVHLTGAGYRLVGETLYRDLIAHYEAFRKIRAKVFSEGNQGNGQAGKNH
jgi:lysophospholipase L1-like esterase